MCLSVVAGPLTDAFDIDTSVRVFAVLSLLPVVAIMRFVPSDCHQHTDIDATTDSPIAMQHQE